MLVWIWQTSKHHRENWSWRLIHYFWISITSLHHSVVPYVAVVVCKHFVIDVTDHSRVQSTSSSISVLFWWWKSIGGFLEIIWVQMKMKMQCWLVSCSWFCYTMPKKQTVALWHNRFLSLIGLIKPPSVIYIWQRGHCHVFSWPASLSACWPVGPLKRRPLCPSACR